jgi:hypothetical protein
MKHGSYMQGLPLTSSISCLNVFAAVIVPPTWIQRHAFLQLPRLTLHKAFPLSHAAMQVHAILLICTVS